MKVDFSGFAEKEAGVAEFSMFGIPAVALLAGAWIETLNGIEDVSRGGVALLAGAWIETVILLFYSPSQ